MIQGNTYVLEFQEVWQRRLPKYLWRDASESVPLHLLSFTANANFARVQGTLLVKNRPRMMPRSRRNQRSRKSDSVLLLQLEDDVNALENALAFYGDSGQGRSSLSQSSPAVRSEHEFGYDSSQTSETVPQGIEVPADAFGYVYSDEASIVFDKPIYIDSFFLRINALSAEQLRQNDDSSVANFTYAMYEYNGGAVLKKGQIYENESG